MSRFSELVFAQSVKNRKLIIRSFLVLYGLIILLLIIGGRSVYYLDDNSSFFFRLAPDLGRTSLVIFSVVLIPGIARRYGIKHKLIFPVMIYRRSLGITMFLLALTHASFLSLIPLAASGFSPLIFPLFQWFGIFSLFFLSFLFITSNDFSVSKLGIWWHWIHKLIYLVMFLILFHVGLQRISFWTWLLGLIVFGQIGSFFYSRFILYRKK